LKWPNLKVLVNPKQEFKKKTEILFGAFLLSAIEFKIRPLVTQNFILFNFFHVGVIPENRSRAVFERDGLIYFFTGLFFGEVSDAEGMPLAVVDRKKCKLGNVLLLYP
jgi:hypothetical protein